MDDTQLGQLYERYGFLVHRRCLQLVRRPEDAEEALQETFLRVKRYGPPREGEATLAWLYTVASRCCFDLMEKRGRERGARAKYAAVPTAHRASHCASCPAPCEAACPFEIPIRTKLLQFDRLLTT